MVPGALSAPEYAFKAWGWAAVPICGTGGHHIASMAICDGVDGEVR
jgi:hypothetical protein